MSDFKIIVPESTTNLITNPSAEEATTGWTATGGSRARSTAQAARGYASIAVTPTAGTADGVYYGTISLTIGLTYTMSVDVLGVAGVPYRIYFASTAGVVLGTPYEFVGTGAWQRVEVTYTETSTTTRRVYIVKNNSASTGVFYVDGLQVEAKAYATTYCDGDIVGHRDDGYQWTGARHASTSTRHEQERSGGRVRDIVDDLSVSSVKATGIGVPDEVLHTEDLSLLPGALYQTSKVGPRYIDLEVVFQGTSIANLHARRKAFRQAIKRNKTTPDQPFRLRYTGGDTDLEIDALYAGGLGQNSLSKYVERAAVRLFCAQPYWRGIGNRAVALTVRQSVSNANYIIQRSPSGTWSALGSGLGSRVNGMAAGPNNLIYVVGGFTTAGGSSANRIATWSPSTSTWANLSTGLNNNGHAVAIGPDGSAYVGGAFTSPGAGIAKWGGSSWSTLGAGISGGTATVYAVVVGADGVVYFGGNFTSPGNYVVKWDGSSLSALGSGPGGEVLSLAIGPDGRLYAGRSLAGGGGVRVWDGSSWSTIGTWPSSYPVYDLKFAPNGTLWAVGGGLLDGIVSYWNGVVWTRVGYANNVPYTLFIASDGAVIVGGDFTQITGTAGALADGLIPPDRLAQFKNNVWTHVSGLNFNGTPQVKAILEDNLGYFYIGLDSDGSPAITSAVTSLTYAGTADTYPRFVAIGPGALYELTNWTVGHSIYFDLTLNSGETVILDLNPEKIRFTSSFRGDIISSILAGSDVADWRLQEGVNQVSLFLDNASAAAYLVWPEMFEAADG